MKIVYLLFVLAPLPFASARPIWQYFWVIFIGLLGLLYAMRWKSLNPIILPKAFYAPIGAMVFLLFFAMLQVLLGWSTTPHHTINAALFFLSHIVCFILVFASFSRNADVPRFILMVGGIATVYSAYGLLVYFAGNDTILWYRKWDSSGSLTSTFVNRNNFATYAGMGLQCIVAFILWNFSLNSKQSTSFKANLVDFFSRDYTRATMLLLSFIFLMTGLLLTASRAGITSSILATLCLILIFSATLSNKELKGISLKPTALTAVSVLLLLLLIDLSGDEYIMRLIAMEVDDIRPSVYLIMANSLLEAPITGTGLGTFAETFAQDRTPQIPVLIRRGHSDILELFMTGGLFSGLAIIGSFLFVAVYSLRRALEKCHLYIFLYLIFTLLLQLGLNSILDFPMQIPAISYQFAGLVAAGAYLAANHNRPLEHKPQHHVDD